jgi:opacity protein-like surface antigen
MITNNYISFEMSHLSIPFGLKYNFKGKTFTAFINGGLSETRTLHHKSGWTQTVEQATLFNTYHKETIELAKGQLGLWAGAGYSFGVSKNLLINLELRYERCQGINESMYAGMEKSSMSDFQIVLGLSNR